MTGVRFAVQDDMQAILRLCNKFHAEFPVDCIPSMEHAEQVLVELVEKQNVFVYDANGVTGMLVFKYIPQSLWSGGILQEVLWYSEDHTGWTLLKAFVRHAKDLGAAWVYVTTLEDSPERARTLLHKLGFNPIERSYALRL